jgi:hypothetical protein
VLFLAALRARFAPAGAMRVLGAVLSGLWPVGYAVGFAVLPWRYNPRLLIQVLVVSPSPPNRRDLQTTVH